MRLSASGKGFHRVYLNQAQEAFFDGHVRAFEHFGGVPDRMIRYDNLKPAVVRVLKGRDRERDRSLHRLPLPLRLRQLLLPARHRGCARERRRRRRGRALPPSHASCLSHRVSSMAELNELCEKGDTG